MSFFKTLDDKFFNPFCCRNRELYFECISQLIERSKEISVLYETDARNALILYLQNCTYSIETENIGEEIAGGKLRRKMRPQFSGIFAHVDGLLPRRSDAAGTISRPYLHTAGN